MLIRFRVGNFLSFDEVQELSMICGSTRNHSEHVFKTKDVDLLKISAIYGANASGKSNLIDAIESARMMIVAGIPIRSNRYFRPKPPNKNKISLLEFEFEMDNEYYSYGFEILLGKQRIESEWLSRMDGNENDVFFQRTGNRIVHNFLGDEKVRMDIYAEDMADADSTLFLGEVNRRMPSADKGLSVFSRIYGWFSHKLKILSSEWSFYGSDELSDDERKKIVNMMAMFGTGITDIGYERVESISSIFPDRSFADKILTDIRDRMIKDRKKDPSKAGKMSVLGEYRITLSDDNELAADHLVFKHGNPDVSFGSEEESEGTRRLYDLLAMITSQADDVTYVMDELDLKLHPQLTFGFVELFLNEKTDCRTQLIFTTHESYLMDFQLLRRDEIWFVQKNEDESTSLYSLEDFNERTDRKIDKAYLEGRYGGVPVFSSVFPNVFK